MKLNCTLRELLEAAFRAILLRYGCTTCQADSLQIEPGADNGGNIALASVRASDGRELFRVYDLEDLDRLMSDKGMCQSLARNLRRITAAVKGEDIPGTLRV